MSCLGQLERRGWTVPRTEVGKAGEGASPEVQEGGGFWGDSHSEGQVGPENFPYTTKVGAP